MARRPRSLPVQQNPLLQLRSQGGRAWKVPGEDVIEVDPKLGWNVVGNTISGDRGGFHGAAWLRCAIELHRIPSPRPFAQGPPVGPEQAEIHVYIVEFRRFDGLQPDLTMQVDTRLFGDMRDSERTAAQFEWIKENASTVIRGSSADDVVSGGAGMVWWGVLFNFIEPDTIPDTPWERLMWSTPVSIDGAAPITLNEALLNEWERELFQAIEAQAQARREYDRENEDAVSDYIDVMWREFRNATLEGEMVMAGPNGHGRIRRESGARTRLLDLLQAVPVEDQKDQIGDMIQRDAKFWHRGPNTVEGGPDGENEYRRFVDRKGRVWDSHVDADEGKHYIFFEYETEDLVTEQLADETVEMARALSLEERQNVSEALDRVGVRWGTDFNRRDDDPENINIEDVDAGWRFTIDMDALEEWVIEYLAEAEAETDE